VKLLAIDPGNEASAWLIYQQGIVREHGYDDNLKLLASLYDMTDIECMAIEGIASYGMPVGAEVFQTCIWIGRFIERWDKPHTLVYRKDVKLHLCGSTRAKDSNVRQAIIDRYGGKANAIGNVKAKGPLYGVKSHAWSALAVAITAEHINNTSTEAA
jgi:hypothetical protein